jgi:DNA polymerase I-like protein with 3'-5' exonuclease and polymerase domains
MAEATQKAANYTAEMVDSMIEMYNELGNDGLDQIAESLDKTVRSVRSKLVREGVYVASPKKTAMKQDGPSKKEILRDIEAQGFDVSGFEGATKAALTRLMGVVAH